jgi:hypothetical protein
MVHLSGSYLGKILNLNLEIRPLRFSNVKAMFWKKEDRRRKDAATGPPLLFLQSVELIAQFDLHLPDVLSGRPIGVFFRQAPTSV